MVSTVLLSVLMAAPSSVVVEMTLSEYGTLPLEVNCKRLKNIEIMLTVLWSVLMGKRSPVEI